jgi:hypothetical protein
MRNKGLVASVSALATLGLIGGCMIVAGGGFTASGKRSEWHVFVSGPQAFIMAAIIFSLSAIAVTWLLQQYKVSRLGYVVGANAYVVVACIGAGLFRFMS